MNRTEDLWTSCAEALRVQVSDATWQAFLSGITPLTVAEDEIVLAVPNSLIRDRVESRFLALIQDTVAGTVGRTVMVRLEVVAPSSSPSTRRSATPSKAWTGRPGQSPATGRGLGPTGPSPTIGRPRRAASQVRGRFSTLATPSRPSSSARPTVSPTPQPNPSPRRRPGRTTRCSSTATPGSARPTSSRRSATTSSRTSRSTRALRVDRDLHERVRRRHPHQRHHGLQAALPRVRRPAPRRHPVHGGQGVTPGGVLPHLQLPLRSVEADRDHLGPAAEVDRHPRGPAPQPLHVRPHHRHPATRARDPARHPPDQGRARARRTCPTTCSTSSPPT